MPPVSDGSGQDRRRCSALGGVVECRRLTRRPGNVDQRLRSAYGDEYGLVWDRTWRRHQSDGAGAEVRGRGAWMNDGHGLKVLAVDDEPPALDELAFLLGRDDRVSEVQTCGSATQALRVLRDAEFDLVLLDIAMPGLSGLELARVLRQFRQSPAVVFVTAHAHHAVDAFDLRAVDYLLKPVHEDRLGEAIDRVPTSPPATTRASRSRWSSAGVTRFVSAPRSVTSRAQGDYVRLHTATENHLVRMPLARSSTVAEAGFVRIHR